jgi:putative N6-adenine-specific DNA methylase
MAPIASPMNLDRRIRHRIIGARHAFFAVTWPGYEELGRRELEQLFPNLELGPATLGGVTFKGRLTDLYLANLQMRTAGRILMRLTTFKAAGFGQLEKHAKALTWPIYLPAGAIPRIHVTARHSRLYHSQAVAERIQKSIVEHWTALGIGPTPCPGQCLYVRLLDDQVTFSLDSSGPNLHRRGLKTHAARAPLRETLAAVILRLADFQADEPLLDPMCGAGTFSLEAALMAKTMAPGLRRSFAFMAWPAFRPPQWNHLQMNATRAITRLERPLIWASDMESAACSALSACIRQNGLADAVRVVQKDFFSLQPAEVTDQTGLVVLNPPYGRRVQAAGGVEGLYHRIAAKLRRDFQGWKAALLVPGASLAGQLGLPLKALPLAHGGLQLTLLTGTITSRRRKEDPRP